MDNFTFTQQPTLSVRERVFNEIRNAILNNSLAPGTRLKENEIAKQMGVSRVPVREAILQLEYEGLVESGHYKETVVASIQGDAIADYLIPIRYHLESTVIRKHKADMDEAFFAGLEAILEEMQSHLDDEVLSFWVDQDMKFHEWIIRLAPEPIVQSIWGSISQRIKLHFNAKTSSYDKEQFISDHRHLLAVLRTKDDKQIAAALREHMNLY